MDTDEPLGVLCGENFSFHKQATIIPHIPYYLADGNTLVKKWKESFTDRLGNKAMLTKVVFKTRKDKLNEAVVRVEWE